VASSFSGAKLVSARILCNAESYFFAKKGRFGGLFLVFQMLCYLNENYQ
jgi:hypothetical protein